MLSQTLSPFSRRFNAVWFSEPVDVPDSVVGGEWTGAKVVYNMGRLKSFAHYRTEVMEGMERDYLWTQRDRDMLVRTNGARWMREDIDADSDEFKTAMFEFAERYTELTDKIVSLERRIVKRKASYLLWSLDLPNEKIDISDETDLDWPELYPLLEWAVGEAQLQEVAQGVTDPKSTSASTTTSS